MVIVPNNWSDLQHYKDRNPPWVKLHKKLLDNFEFHCLPVASRALAPMLWLLASEHENGHIDADAKKIAFRLRMSEQDAADALKPLIDNGFFIEVQQAASKPLAKLRRAARPETETETEEENIHPGFTRFWSVWPKSDRKASKGKCLETWVKAKAEGVADQVIAHVERLKNSPGWQKQNGEFIPAPLVYLNKRSWEGADDTFAAWWQAAGFTDQFEAENAGCRQGNARLFRDGKRLEATT